MPYLIVEEEVGVGLSGVGDIDTHGGTTQVCAPDRVYLQEATTGGIYTTSFIVEKDDVSLTL